MCSLAAGATSSFTETCGTLSGLGIVFSMSMKIHILARPLLVGQECILPNQVQHAGKPAKSSESPT